MSDLELNNKISVVIPCYKVREHILDVIVGIGDEVVKIIIVDDCCPEGSGDYVEKNCTDSRVVVIRNERNLGVGGAVVAGYKKALEFDIDIVVKLDGDGQMDPRFIPALTRPLVAGEADYAKGNRFFEPDHLSSMPIVRLLGNACLSFLTKLSSGYWNIFDPTNGYTAIHATVIKLLMLDKIDKRFFFESDILFRLNIARAVVADIPMPARYGDEKSNLKILHVVPEFLYKNLRNFAKRIFYNYFLRDFNVASLEIVLGSVSTACGIIFGLVKLNKSWATGIAVTSGTVMFAALPIIIGVQLLLSFVGYDVQNVPKSCLHKDLYLQD